MSDHKEETINKENAHPKVVPQITTVTNISAKFRYLKKEDAKSMTTDKDGNLKIRHPVTVEEHQQIQREEKARKILLSALPDEHMEEGLDKVYDKMQKILSQMNTLKIKPETKDESRNGGYGSYTTTLFASPGSSSSKGSLKSKCSVVDDVIYSFFANYEIDQQLVYEDLDQMNKEEFKEYDLKHQMGMLSIKVHRFEKKHGWKIKFNGRENARFDKKLVKCFNYKQMGHFSKECRDQDADSEGKVVYADDVIPAGVSIPAGTVVAAVAAQEKHELMTKLDNEIANQAKWNSSGKNLYKLIDSSMSVRTKRGLRLDKYIREGDLGIDDSQFSIFHTNSDELEGQPIYNRFASVDHMKAVPPPLTGNYMPPSNIPDIDESHMVYGKKATDSSEIKTTDDSITHTNDPVLFDFSDRSSKPSTNDLKMCDSSIECSQPNHNDHDSTSSVFAPVSESRDTIVIDSDKQEDFPSVCSIETDVKSSKPLCNKFGAFNKESHFRKHKSVASKSCYKTNRKPINLNRPKLVFAGQQNPVSAGLPNSVSTRQQNTVSAGQPNLIFTGQQNIVFAGQLNPVSGGQQNTVSAGPPNPVYAGQPNPVYAGNGILGP
nr:ribonuclease H-like domain-containing protein [Tanacetum cinerariifolium]